MEKRPVQEMADTVSALKAAKEVGADTLAPELFRQAVEAYTRSKNEYRFKNFLAAKSQALKAKRFAEEAEYRAILQGAARASLTPYEPPPPPPPPPPPEDPQQGTPAFILEQQAQAAQQAQQSGGSPPPAGGAPSAPVPPANDPAFNPYQGIGPGQ